MHTLRRPKIELQNYENVYRYYRTHEPNSATSWFGYHAMDMMMSPVVTYEPGAEDDIHDHMASGGLMVMEPNHQLDTDQYVIAALAASEPLLRPLQGRTYVLTRPDIPGSNLFIRLGVDTMGAIPAWREKDDRDKTEEARLLRADATALLLDTCVHRMINLRNHGALFAEGTRNTGDVSQLLRFRHGASNIILSATQQGADVLALTIAVHYPENDKKIRRHASVRIGRLVRNAPTTREEATNYTTRVQSAVQRCLDYTFGRTA
jgi:1-acyl-sn-glycerol-3-phosphate acyltransferase